MLDLTCQLSRMFFFPFYKREKEEEFKNNLIIFSVEFTGQMSLNKVLIRIYWKNIWYFLVIRILWKLFWITSYKYRLILLLLCCKMNKHPSPPPHHIHCSDKTTVRLLLSLFLFFVLQWHLCTCCNHCKAWQEIELYV